MTLEQLKAFKESLTDWSWVKVDEEPDVLITFELKLVSAFISMVGYRYASDTSTDIDKGMVSIMLGPICARYGISLGPLFMYDDKEEEERQKISCTICDNPKPPIHSCPYFLPVKGYDKKCYCCESCTDECREASKPILGRMRLT
jgi:hypothetical protein